MNALHSLEMTPLTRLLKSLGDETRLRIVALLTYGELCVCHIESALGLSQPTASRHLSVLKNSGVVQAKRRGTWVYYSLASQTDDFSKRQLQALMSSFGKNEVLRRETVKLLKANGPGACK